MKHFKYLIALALLSISFSLYADGIVAPKEKMIKELLVSMEMDKTGDKLLERFKPQLKQIFIIGGGGENNDVVFKQYIAQLTKSVSEDIKWKKIEPDFVKLYDEEYTEKEIKAMLQFYKSPEGQSILKKTSVITEKSTPIVQKIITVITPEIQKMAKRMQKEVSALIQQEEIEAAKKAKNKKKEGDKKVTGNSKDEKNEEKEIKGVTTK